jgi:hypothetical protein
MALEKKDNPAEKKLAEVLPPYESGPGSEEEEEKVVPAKGSDGYDTPSGYALAKVGTYDGDDPDKAREHGLKYLYEKVKKRWGYGS